MLRILLAAALAAAFLAAPASAQTYSAPGLRMPTSDTNVEQLCAALPSSQACTFQRNKTTGATTLLPAMVNGVDVSLGYVDGYQLNYIIGSVTTSSVLGGATYDSANMVYSTLIGPKPLPPSVLPGQHFIFNAPVANQGPASLNPGGLSGATLGPQPIKARDSSGALGDPAPGSIVGNTEVVFDGSEYVTVGVSPRTLFDPDLVTPTSSDFAYATTIVARRLRTTYNDGQKIILPCAATTPAGGAIVVVPAFEVDITLGSTCSTDRLIRNGATTANPIAIAQGSPVTRIISDGVGTFTVSGQ